MKKCFKCGVRYTPFLNDPNCPCCGFSTVVAYSNVYMDIWGNVITGDPDCLADVDEFVNQMKILLYRTIAKKGGGGLMATKKKPVLKKAPKKGGKKK